MAGINVWTTHGPTGGSIHALAIDPTSATTLYAATYHQGVFKSTDGGINWRAVNTGLDPAYLVLTFAIDPAARDTVYAGTFGYGVFKSSDGGDTWSATGLNRRVVGYFVRALAIDPTISATLYAGTDDGVFKSTDGGASWQALNTGLPNESDVRALAIDPTSPSTLYAGTVSPVYAGTGLPVTDSGVFKSTDGGGTWNATALKTDVVALVVDPFTPTTLYAGTAFQLPSDNGVFKSTDGGETWSATNATQTGYVTVAVDPTTPATLYVGTFPSAWGSGVFKSTDGGITWTTLAPGLTNTAIYSLAISHGPSSIIYVGTNRGVFALQQVPKCPGDCNGDGQVTIDEILLMLDMALGDPALNCAAADVNRDAKISVDEILAAVNNALSGCPILSPTPTPAPTSELGIFLTCPVTPGATALINGTPIVIFAVACTPTPTPSSTPMQ